MAKRAYELLVRFGQGEVVAGAHIKEMDLDEQGNDIRETAPIPLADTDNPVFEAFVTKFSAKTVAENEVLKSEKATLESEKSALTSQVASLTQQVTNLTEQKETLVTEKSELVASHAEEKSELILNHLAEKAELNAALAAANARIVHLTNELPFNPREISVHSFKARLFQVLETEDVVRMYAVDSDPILKQIASTIANWDSQYPILLDSQELQQPLAYLVTIDLLTPNEVTFLRQDCVRSEAYFAPEEE